jgi:hypothetical protein
MSPVFMAWTDIFERIERAKQSVYCAQKGAWLRGHRSGNWTLLPSLLRSPKGISLEETLMAEVQRLAPELIKEFANEWELLSAMQHHGVPTRLMDWTEKLDVALFFALIGEPDRPCIWVLNPYLLGAKTMKTGQEAFIYDFAEDSAYRYSSIWQRNNTWPFELPVPIYSPWKFKRIDQQGGCFTFHGNSSLQLETLVPKFVKRVDIPHEDIPHIRKHLENNGINEFSLMRDFDSLSRFIVRKHGLFERDPLS